LRRSLNHLRRAPSDTVDEADLSSLHIALDFREPADYADELPATLQFIDWVLAGYAKFDTGCSAFGDQRPKYEVLRAKLAAQNEHR